MNPEPLRESEFNELLGGLLDDQLSTEEHARLEAALAENKEFRSAYRRMMRTHASLAWSRRWSVENESVDPNSRQGVTMESFAEPDDVYQKRGGTYWRATTGVVSLALAASLLVMLFREPLLDRSGEADLTAKSVTKSVAKSPQSGVPFLPIDGQIDAAVAMISESIGVQWADGNEHHIGDSLPPMSIQFDGGLLQLDFLCGARLVCRGPLEMELLTAKSVRIHAGEATCYVGEMGRGFQILAGDNEVVDLGTSFGIRVEPSGESEVHVFEGVVAVGSNAEPERFEYTEQSAVRLTDRERADATYSSDSFLRFEDLQTRRLAESRVRQANWKQYGRSINADPDVLLHYGFDEQNERDIEVVNQSESDDRGTNGTILGAKWCEGRWAGKKGLRFERPGDRVLTKIPGQYDTFSFVMWARPDAFLQSTTALILTEHPNRWKAYGNLSNEELHNTTAPVDTFRWTVSNRGVARLNLAHRVALDSGYEFLRYYSGYHPKPQERNGRWICYGVTLDAAQGQVTHYYNGKRVGVNPVEKTFFLPLDTMEIGNHSGNAAERQEGMIYRFFGVIDEIIVARRVFSDDEMGELYRIGNPNGILSQP